MMRIGQGYDIHPLRPGLPLVLCGVRIAHDRGLAGDSDADVALHALMDALLGAMGAGDLGARFPPGSLGPGARSRPLLLTVLADMDQAGFHLVNADLTILAEAPRLAPHRDAMVRALREATGVQAVSVKFKTGDGLGPVGRREAMAAHAVVLLEQ